MREVFIISTGEIINGKTAGARRIMNIAKALASGGVTVYLCSLYDYQGSSTEFREIHQGIYSLSPLKPEEDRQGSILKFVRTILNNIRRRDSDLIIYLYPTTFVLKDFFYLLYFKYLKGIRFFCEINELRSAIAFSSLPPRRMIPLVFYYVKSAKDFIIYRLNEFQVYLYDGIVVISTKLGDYFSRSAHRILRVPILCDAGQIDHDGHPAHYDGKIFRICFAGYINCAKEGFNLLFEALSRVDKHQKVELYLYGILTDEDNESLGRLSREFDLKERVFYKGNIAPERLNDEFRKYHLLILPRPLNKRTMYGFSTKLSEYLVSWSPVLLTDVSDNALYIRDNFNGYIVPQGNVDAMETKIIEIINGYNQGADLIVRNAHKTVIEELDYKLFSDTYINFFFPGDRHAVTSG